MGAVLGRGPEGVVLPEPFADGAVDADVLPLLLGLNPLVFQDFIALIQEILPQVAVGKGFRRFGDLGNGAGFAVALVLLQGRDGDFEEPNRLGGEVNLPGRLGGVRGWDEEGTAPHDVLAGDKRQVLTAREVEGGGTGVNFGKLRLGKGDANRSLAF